MAKNPATRAIDYLATQQWAMQPEMMGTMLAIAERANGTPESVAAALGRPLDNTRTVEVRDGVAVVPVIGPLFRYANLFTAVSGASSIDETALEFSAAVNNPAVEQIILHVDSPGGMVSGTSEFAQLIRESSKPVTAFVSDTGASAAYWIASAAGRVMLANTARVGSIGVVVQYGPATDDGSRKIISSQSPLKHAGPDTEAGLAAIQHEIDALANVFIAAVADHRGVSVETVLSEFGQGGVLVGQHAVDAGMADGVGTLESLIQELADPGSMIARVGHSIAGNSPAQPARPLGTTGGDPDMDPTLESISADHPDIAEALRAEGRAAAEQTHAAEAKEQIAAATTEGADQERARIQAVLDQNLPGHEALVNSLAFDGKTTGPEAAVAVLQAQRKKQADQTGAIAADAGDIPPIEGSTSATGDDSAGIDTSAPIEQQTRAIWDRSPDLRAEFGEFGAYLAFAKAEADGRFKLMRRDR